MFDMHEDDITQVALAILCFYFMVMVTFGRVDTQGTVTIDTDNIEIQYIPSK